MDQMVSFAGMATGATGEGATLFEGTLGEFATQTAEQLAERNHNLSIFNLDNWKRLFNPQSRRARG